MDHTWLRVVRLLNKNCIFIMIGCFINFLAVLLKYLISSGNIKFILIHKIQSLSIERRLNLTLYRKSFNGKKRILNNFSNATSAHVRLLPEFKHINEGRKRN